MRPCKNPCVTHISKSVGGDEDHISNLPDGIVGLILSRVHIKDAVRTSVLSQDWKHKWTSICEIEIGDKQESLSGEADVACFVNIVTRILMRTCNMRISSFSLLCEQNYHMKYLETWISWVLMRNVENLKVEAYKIQRIDSVWCFSGWTSLTKLELSLSCTLVLPLDNCFPNLKCLCLISGILHGSIKLKTARIPIDGRVILKFPVLRELVLRRCEWMDVNFVEIHAPELINFQTSCVKEIKYYEIKIFATKLAMFDVSDGSINNFDLHTSSTSCVSLYHNSIVWRKQNKQDRKTLLMRTHKILKQFPHLTCLKLSSEILKDLLPAPDSEFGLVIPVFNRLKEFHLDACTPNNAVIGLGALPLLESLYMSALFWDDDEEWEEPWPAEIFSNLKKVQLTEFDGEDLAFDFSIFILESAKKLNEMLVKINKASDITVEVATRRLSIGKPKSSSCRILVSQ